MTRFRPTVDPPVEWLYLDAETPIGQLAPWLAAALPHCAWTCHVVITGSNRAGRLIETVEEYIRSEPVALVHLHLLIDAYDDASDAADRLAEAAAHFQREAYRERTGARLVPLPILEVGPGMEPGPALKIAGEMAARLAKPSLLLWDEPDEKTITTAAALGLRLYLGSEGCDSSVLEILTAAHVLDGAMDRMESVGGLLGQCWTHQVIAGGRIFDCAQQWRRGRSGGELSEREHPSWQPDTDLCAGCIADTIAGMAPSLVANQRRREGRELALRASSALIDGGAAHAASEVAGTAAELSPTRSQRADALIQAALCRLAEGRLRKADATLIDAAASGAPAGLIAFHRAQVQVAWRDDIEALDRYDEALELGTDAISPEDLHFEMAMSHIRLEEWAAARTHLELAGGPSAAISFNLGVCDVNDQHADRALGHFDRALELSPPEEDLGRVRFFRGFCLKELERYEEAADDLRRSIELEKAELAHHNSLGFCLFKLGRYGEAVESFERAVQVDPTSAIDWANIGVNLERLGEHLRADEMYRKALGMDPSIGFAREGLERVGGGGGAGNSRR